MATILRILVALGSPTTVLILFLCTAFHPSGQAAQNSHDPAWRTFRQNLPGHFQDWIVSGLGPQFTLIYAEPPPAYTLDEYAVVLTNVFRGYTDHVIETRSLGYNGKVSDLVIHLDYTFAGRDPLSALEQDLAVFSRAIYGTAHGARLLQLREMAVHSGAIKTPPSISVSADELETWLFGGQDTVSLFSPELGTSGDLKTLMSTGPAGRYLSTDNSLVVLLVEYSRGIDADMLAQLRLFAVDSDLILGGVTDDNFIALIGRSREMPLATFPALRIEDMVNAMTTRDTNWAQSYDRNSPGAGRAVLADGAAEDWAPSYLSAELIDTEFGSLLNYADALLKSQSLSDTIRYRGYPISAFRTPPPPYPEGVFDHLQQKIGLSSLVFNFNTVGVGHWLVGDNKRRIYALNSTGSFSVTYSPDTTGKNSTLEQANPIEDAESTYTAWFRQQQNPALVRTVQYMAIYQVFSGLHVSGPRLYENTTDKFQLIGEQLKQAVKLGAASSLAHLKEDEQETLATIGRERQTLLRFRHQSITNLPPLPTTLEGLTALIADAATAIRYDGNLFGDRFKVLAERLLTLDAQAENAFTPIKSQYEEAKAFQNKYKEYEGGISIGTDGEPKMQYLPHLMPRRLRTEFERDSPINEVRLDTVNPIVKYCNRLQAEEMDLYAKLEVMQASYANREVLLDAVALTISADNPTAFASKVLDAFASRTSPEKLSKSKHAIVTPTVVVSVDKSDVNGTMTGGHNVEVQRFSVRRDSSLPTGSFRFSGGELWLSSADAPKMGQISARMARVADADPATQQKAFASALKSDNITPTPRLVALGFEQPGNSARFESGKEREAIYTAEMERGRPSKEYSRTLVFGRDHRSNRLFAERPGSDGEPHRVTMFGATMSPEIIARGSAQNNLDAEVSEVVFDSSLNARDIETIIANYKNTRGVAPQAAEIPASGGGGNSGVPPRSRWASAEKPKPRGPRMVLFTETRTGRQRAVVETERGRVELIIPSGTKGREVLAALKTKIASGAELTLKTTSEHHNGMGTQFLLVGFEIAQPTPVKGQVIAESSGGGLFRNGLTAFRKLIQSAFNSVRGDEKTGDTVADYVVEVNRRVGTAEPEWKLEWKLAIGPTGMRFVFQRTLALPQDEPKESLLIADAERQ